tara:strand:- start:426 stop:650 length:225 start_codon:yes stop_codon:yes gene_type:complete
VKTRAAKQFTGYLLLQNMLLSDFVREGLASQSLGREDAARLSRLKALNAAEIARWERDLSMPGNESAPVRTDNG